MARSIKANDRFNSFEDSEIKATRKMNKREMVAHLNGKRNARAERRNEREREELGFDARTGF